MFLLRTLGSVQLVRSGSSEEPVASHAKRLALLLFLARGARSPLLRRDVLLALLWPDSDENHARAALRQALSGLRKQLGPAAILTQGEDEVGLASEVVSCDATEFERAAAAGRYAEACERYRGDFAAGFHVTGLAAEFDQWLEAERTRLRQLALRSAGIAADQAEKDGRLGEAVTVARWALRQAPDDEASAAQLIALLDRSGDRSAALAVYQAFERHIRQEYSSTPSPETRALIESVRNRSDPREMQTGSAGQGTASPAVAPQWRGATGPVPLPERRSRRRLVTAGLLGTIAVVASVAALARVGRPLPSPLLLAVQPFTVAGADSSLHWLGEGMVDLLSIRLSGVEGLEIVEPGRGVTAGRTVHGRISGASSNVVLTSWIQEEPGGRALAQASVSGPSDSLQQLIDRLAIQLIGQSAGLEADRLASSTSRSIPAIRLFLAGRAAFRAGRMEEALQYFRSAVHADSDFAVAAFDLYRTTAWATGDPHRIGERRAVARRDRLSPVDRALLDAMQSATSEAMFANWNLVTTEYPDRAEGWYGLGGAYFHWGALSGIEGSLTWAELAYRRGWQLDSAAQQRSGSAASPPSVAEPVMHMVELAHIRGDTAEVRRLVRRVLARDSTTDLARTLQWHLAMVDGDSARRVFWDRIGSASQRTTMWIVLFIIWSGVGAEDFGRASAEDGLRLRVQDPGYTNFATRLGALNSGRPSRVPAFRSGIANRQRPVLRSRLGDAIWWDGDSSEAAEAATLLTRLVEEPTFDTRETRNHYQEVCALGQWQVAVGDLSRAETASRRLHAARLPALEGRDSASFAQSTSLCAALIDAAIASGRKPASVARTAIWRADSMARSSVFQTCCGEVGNANLLLARLWERSGDLPNALRALRRRAGGYGIAPLYLSTFLREEGRLAALTGDTTGAIRAYQHYLMLRPDPEPSIRPAVERVRRALDALGGHNPLAVSH